LEEQDNRRPRDPSGKPVVKGARIAVEHIVELLANGWAIEEVLENYPQLKREDVLAALKYAAWFQRHKPHAYNRMKLK
jgi:uncharacterized protein (DUF433 family)